ncbi:MAG: protein kinase [Kofleriaceae bacterium]|nr:protein kinase [Kofleriaceae bacterium]
MSACPRCCRSFESSFVFCPACLLSPDELEPIRVGSLVLHEELGRGGMGVVYRAHHTRLDREVAVKLMTAGIVEHESFQLRLEREAKLLALLDHPNIVRVFDAGNDQAQLYLAMEFVRGESLSELGLVSQERAIEIAIQIADALSHAHQRGVIHRDIKPSNIMLTEDGDVKVGDFGIARFIGDQLDLSITRTDVAVGSPAYMSPEAIAAEEPSPCMDIYSLGVLLYELISGRQPIGVFPSIDGPINSVVRKALASDPADRYESMEQMRDALKHSLALQNSSNSRRTWYWLSGGAVAIVIAATTLLLMYSEEVEKEKELVFQAGNHGYHGTSDHWFSRRENERFSVSEYLRTADWSDANQQAVLQFGGLFGDASRQVPRVSKLLRATLVLTVPKVLMYAEGEANGVHKILVDWHGQGGFSTKAWAGGATGAIDRDDVEASKRVYDNASRYAQASEKGPTIPRGTTLEFDVTDIVRDWQSGQPNYGFLLQSSGGMNGDGLFMASSRWYETSERPALKILYEAL